VLGRVGVMCPVTSRAKGYPFEVGLPAGLRVSGPATGQVGRSAPDATQ